MVIRYPAVSHAMRRAGWAPAVLAGLLAGCVQQAPPAVEQGIVLSAHPANQAGETTGAGGVAGVVVGTALGAAIGGRGAGQVAGAFIGAAVGGTAGDAAEAAASPPDGMAYTIRLTDGRVETVIEHVYAHDIIFAAGSHVGIETNGGSRRIVPAS